MYKDEILFEGEFLNDQRWNGSGKILDLNDEIQFEGNYLNGKWNGKGKEYNGKELIFEGEFLDGKRWKGKGKVYDEYNNLIFEGAYFNGEKSGPCKNYFKGGGLCYKLHKEYELVNGKINGKYKEYDLSGKIILEVEYLLGDIIKKIKY